MRPVAAVRLKIDPNPAVLELSPSSKKDVPLSVRERGWHFPKLKIRDKNMYDKGFISNATEIWRNLMNTAQSKYLLIVIPIMRYFQIVPHQFINMSGRFYLCLLFSSLHIH